MLNHQLELLFASAIIYKECVPSKTGKWIVQSASLFKKCFTHAIIPRQENESHCQQVYTNYSDEVMIQPVLKAMLL